MRPFLFFFLVVPTWEMNPLECFALEYGCTFERKPSESLLSSGERKILPKGKPRRVGPTWEINPLECFALEYGCDVLFRELDGVHVVNSCTYFTFIPTSSLVRRKV